MEDFCKLLHYTVLHGIEYFKSTNYVCDTDHERRVDVEERMSVKLPSLGIHGICSLSILYNNNNNNIDIR